MEELYEYKGVMCRVGTMDKFIVDEMNRVYSCMDVEGKVVFDIGANIGAYSLYALDNGAKEIHAYEPLPDHVEIFGMNVDSDIVNLYPYAIGPHDGNSKLYIAPNRVNYASTSTQHFRGRDVIEVEMLSFLDECDELRPDVMKIDCEGAEYEFLLGTAIPDHVRAIVMEIHLNKKKWREKDAPRLIKQFSSWNCVKEPKITRANWYTVGCWVR